LTARCSDIVIFNLRRLWHGLKAKVKSKRQIAHAVHYVIHMGNFIALRLIRYPRR
jgi:hypothetical protein